MPTYDYECQACGKSHEFFHGISETPKIECPSCGSHKLRRLIGAGAGFLFRGAGFYVTDYRSPDYKAKAKAESSGGSSSTGGAKDSSSKASAPSSS